MIFRTVLFMYRYIDGRFVRMYWYIGTVSTCVDLVMAITI